MKMGIHSTTYQPPFFTVFYSGGANPFIHWDIHIENGHISRILDPDLKTLVTDLCGCNVSTTYITCPKGKNQSLGIYLPFMVLIIKNLKKYFAFEVTIRDDTGLTRRFRVANFLADTKVNFNSTVMPICLADGWNQVQFNLADFTRRAYNREFMEVVSLRINANIRLKRIYFAQKLTNDDDLPRDYKLFYPLQRKKVQKHRKEHVYLANGGVPLQCNMDGFNETKHNIPDTDGVYTSVYIAQNRPKDKKISVISDDASSQHSQEALEKLKLSARTSQELLKKLAEELIQSPAETTPKSQMETKSQSSVQERQRSSRSSRKPQDTKESQGKQRNSKEISRTGSRDSQRILVNSRAVSAKENELQEVFRTPSIQRNDSLRSNHLQRPQKSETNESKPNTKDVIQEEDEPADAQ